LKDDKRTIFRRNAWEAYTGKYEQTVLPRFVTPPVFLFFWVLSGLLLVAGSTAWLIKIPIYAAGSGVLLEQLVSSPSGAHETIALIFLPANHPLVIPEGALIQLQVHHIGPSGNGLVKRVEPGLINPQEARQRYMLNDASASLITGPSIVVFARVVPPLSDHIYVGSSIGAQVPIGTQSLLTLLFGSRN
jgi:hypothetical protein